MHMRTLAVMVVIAVTTPVAAQQVPPSTKGLFVSGHMVVAPGFDINYVPGDYSAEGFTRHISPDDAYIGSTTFGGGVRAVGGWGFNRLLALQAGFDFLLSSFTAADQKEGSGQGSVFAGLRLNAPVSAVTPYAFSNIGAMSVTAKGDVDIYCRVGSGCFPAGSEWNGTYHSFGGGVEFGAWPAGAGHMLIDVHAESIRASLGSDEGANEQYEKQRILRFGVGGVWRYRR